MPKLALFGPLPRDQPHFLTARIPKPVRSGDMLSDQEVEMRRSAYVKLLEGLWREPKYILAVHSFYERQVELAVPQSTTGAGENIFERVSTLRALDEQWCVAFLGRNGIPKALLEQLKVFDNDVVRQLMVWGLAASPSLKLPGACKDREVTSSVFQARAVELKRLREFSGTDFVDGTTHAVLWSMCGCYELVFGKGGYVTHVVHKHTGARATVPEHVHITEKYDLLENYNDFAARVELPPNKYFLHEFFCKASGPATMSFWKGESKEFGLAVQVAVRSVEGRRRAASVGDVKPETSFNEEANIRKRMEAAEKGRSALKARHEQANKKRRISLSKLAPTSQTT